MTLLHLGLSLCNIRYSEPCLKVSLEFTGSSQTNAVRMYIDNLFNLSLIIFKLFCVLLL